MVNQLIFLSLVARSLALDCNDTWIKMSDGCFKISPERMNFVQAVKYCKKEEGYMVEVGNQYAQESLLSFLPRDLNYWLGMRDIVYHTGDEVHSVWIWQHSYQAVGYTNWINGDPNDYESHSDTVAMISAENLKWKDVPSSSEYDEYGIDFHALCEQYEE